MAWRQYKPTLLHLWSKNNGKDNTDLSHSVAMKLIMMTYWPWIKKNANINIPQLKFEPPKGYSDTPLENKRRTKATLASCKIKWGS